MAFKGEQLKVTELDFQTIKRNLIDYIKNSDGEFTDWDFNGSNLNQLMDVLAYNTHYNAMLAHMAVNESFIDSAQIRSNIVSMTKLLGYTPKSYSAAKAELEGRFLANPETNVNSFSLERGTRFNTVSTAGSFQFVVLDDNIPLTKDPTDNAYYITSETNPIIIYQGRLVSKDYIANGNDDSQRYVIDDFNIDISTLKVRIYPTANKTAGTGTLYRPLGQEINISSESNIFIITENSFGRYEIQFGNGVFGRSLKSGNIIEMEYLVCEGSDPNGIQSRFQLASVVNEISSVETLNFTSDSNGVRTRVSGGGERESNNKLKQNATNSFVNQNRAVTADDYKHLILSNFQYVDSVSVWGGEDNDPPLYGQSFIAVKPKESYIDLPENTGQFLSLTDKNTILQFLKGKKVLSILPRIIDPKYVNIILDVLFKYNSNTISTSRAGLENNIRVDVIDGYNQTELNAFDTIFRHSAFQRELDNYDGSILNSLVRVFVSQSFELIAGQALPNATGANSNWRVLDYGVPLVADDGKALVEVKTSETWKQNGEEIFLDDEENASDSNIRDVFSYAVRTGGQIIRKNNIAQINLSRGTLTFNVNSISADSNITVDIILLPRSNDIVGKRNLLLNIDTDRCVVRGTVDEITAGGSSRSVDYITFDRDRTR